MNIELTQQEYVDTIRYLKKGTTHGWSHEEGEAGIDVEREDGTNATILYRHKDLAGDWHFYQVNPIPDECISNAPVVVERIHCENFKDLEKLLKEVSKLQQE